MFEGLLMRCEISCIKNKKMSYCSFDYIQHYSSDEGSLTPLPPTWWTTLQCLYTAPDDLNIFTQNWHLNDSEFTSWVALCFFRLCTCAYVLPHSCKYRNLQYDCQTCSLAIYRYCGLTQFLFWKWLHSRLVWNALRMWYNVPYTECVGIAWAAPDKPIPRGSLLHAPVPAVYRYCLRAGTARTDIIWCYEVNTTTTTTKPYNTTYIFLMTW